jgi:hypothetical protein
MSTPSHPKIPAASSSTAPAIDWGAWSESARANLQAQGLTLDETSLKGVAKGLARMTLSEPATIDPAHRDFNLTLQQVSHV